MTAREEHHVAPGFDIVGLAQGHGGEGAICGTD